MNKMAANFAFLTLIIFAPHLLLHASSIQGRTVYGTSSIYNYYYDYGYSGHTQKMSCSFAYSSCGYDTLDYALSPSDDGKYVTTITNNGLVGYRCGSGECNINGPWPSFNIPLSSNQSILGPYGHLDVHYIQLSDIAVKTESIPIGSLKINATPANNGSRPTLSWSVSGS